MKIHPLNLFALLGVCLMPLLAPAAAPPADPLAAYYDNTLACQDQASKAVCRVWLNRDGHYYAFYDLGPQAKQPDIDGPFRIEGREGTYTLRSEAGSYQLCLWVAAPRIRIGAEKQREIYSEATCYAFTPHKLGESWNESDSSGRSIKLWLLAGR
jgi:hypothetical protein